MIRIFTLKKQFVVFILLMGSLYGNAQSVWTGAVNTNWNTPGNWTPMAAPTQATNVVIPGNAARYPEIMGFDGIADCANLTINQGATVLVNNNGNGKLRVYGGISNSGILDITDGSLIMAGNTPQTIPSSTFLNNTIRNLTIYHTGALGSTTLGGTLNLTGVLKLSGGPFYTGGFLTLKSTASSTALVDKVEGLMAAIIGEVTVERYIPAKRAFRLITPSTTGGTINSNWQEGGSEAAGFGTDITGTGGSTNGFDPTTTNNASLFTHTSSTATWAAVTSTTTGTLTAGKPYRLLVRGDRTINLGSNTAPATATTLRTTGTLSTGNVIFTDLGMDAGDFSMIGNPYQATVDMGAVLADANNLNTDFYYVWDPTLNARGGYTTVVIATNSNTTPGSQANRYLQPNQAVFVQTAASFLPTYITFTEAHKFVFSNATPNLYNEAADAAEAQIKLAMYNADTTDGVAMDGLLVRFNDAYSNDVNNKDAVKPTNQDEGVGLMNSGKILSVESRQIPTAADVIPLANTTYRGTSYTYKVTVSELDNVAAYLQDSYTETSTELANNGETLYNFTVDPAVEASTAQNRFNLVFAETLGTSELKGTAFSVYPNPASGNEFTVQLSSANNPSVTVYNQLGQQVACKTNAYGNILTVTPTAQMGTGIYMVQVENGGKTAVKKLIVK
ncbi:T9SS type A sorting domain-containing protein [Flavobacterium sp. DGU11]|uniref:T9SS type A sorting domain-containing protein n=1 Tax=Flavobacterium arundinis TaxID=3139143 RepID=A0ABU9I0B6_9FLAO